MTVKHFRQIPLKIPPHSPLHRLETRKFFAFFTICAIGFTRFLFGWAEKTRERPIARRFPFYKQAAASHRCRRRLNTPVRASTKPACRYSACRRASLPHNRQRTAFRAAKPRSCACVCRPQGARSTTMRSFFYKREKIPGPKPGDLFLGV